MKQSKITKQAGIIIPPAPPLTLYPLAPSYPIEEIPIPKKNFVFIDYPWDKLQPGTNQSFAAVTGLTSETEAKGERNKISRACKLWKEQNPQPKGLPDRVFKIMVREYNARENGDIINLYEIRVWRIQ